MAITDSQTDIAEVDVIDHDGSTKGLLLAGTLVTAIATELNLNDMATQAVSTHGAITVKNGTAVVGGTENLTLTLANPTATTDDYKRLTIISTTTGAHTVTVTGGYGNGGSGEDVATWSGVKGDNLRLLAYQGYWYVIGAHQVTLA